MILLPDVKSLKPNDMRSFRPHFHSEAQHRPFPQRGRGPSGGNRRKAGSAAPGAPRIRPRRFPLAPDRWSVMRAAVPDGPRAGVREDFRAQPVRRRGGGGWLPGVRAPAEAPGHPLAGEGHQRHAGAGRPGHGPRAGRPARPAGERTRPPLDDWNPGHTQGCRTWSFRCPRQEHVANGNALLPRSGPGPDGFRHQRDGRGPNAVALRPRRGGLHPAPACAMTARDGGLRPTHHGSVGMAGREAFTLPPP